MQLMNSAVVLSSWMKKVVQINISGVRKEEIAEARQRKCSLQCFAAEAK